MSATPSLSAAIRRLEGQLGVELPARRGRRVTVTPAGELLHRCGRELLAHADAVAAEGATAMPPPPAVCGSGSRRPPATASAPGRWPPAPSGRRP